MESELVLESQEEWVDFLKKSSTTVELVKKIYHTYPPLSGHMVEDLYWSKRLDILEFYCSVEWFCMAGKELCHQLLEAAAAAGVKN